LSLTETGAQPAHLPVDHDARHRRRTRVAYMQDLNIRTSVQKSILPYSQVADMSLALEAQKLAG